MKNSDSLASACRDAAAVWRRLAAEALSDDERREALAYVAVFETAALNLDRRRTPRFPRTPPHGDAGRTLIH